MQRRADSLASLLLAGIAVALGAALRLRGLGLQPLFGDEHHTLGELTRSYGEVFASFGTWGSHASLPLLQKACTDLCGASVVSFRLPAVVPGLLVLLVVFPVARGFVGRSAALLSTWAVATAPMLVYYGRFARSYALAVLLALGLLYCVRRALASEAGAWRAWLGAGACAALLPWVHLSTVGLVVGVGLAACALAFRQRSGARAALLTFAAAALVALLLYLPALDDVRAYVEKVSGEVGTAGDVRFLEVTTLLFGNRLLGFVGLPALLVAAALFLRRERTNGVLLAAALAGVVGGFFVSRPYGLAYAYARYFVVALPVAWMLLADGLVALVGRVVRARGAGRVDLSGAYARTLGIALLLALHWTGPLGPTRPTTGAFDNSYLALRALPAFDVPFPDMPEPYERLEGPVIVAPALTTRSVLLYRNYALQHRQRVWTGTFGQVPAPLRTRPYVPLLEPDAVRATGARHLVLHRDAAAEVAAYWDFVYGEAWPSLGGDDEDPDAGLMRRQEKFAPPPAFPPPLEDALRERYGPPAVETDRVLAWDL